VPFDEPRRVVSTDVDGYQLFGQRGGVPGLSSDWPNDFSINGFDLQPSLLSDAIIAATYGGDDSGAALVVSPTLDLAVFGFSPSEAGGLVTSLRVDADGDGVGDVAELTMSLIDLMYERPILLIRDHARPTVSVAAGAMGVPWIEVETRGDVVDALDRWNPALLAVSREGSDAPASDAVLIDDWRRTELPLLFNTWDLDDLPTVQEALGVGVDRSWEVDTPVDDLSLVVPADARWFEAFDEVISGVELNDVYRDSGDVLVPGDDDVVLAMFDDPLSDLEMPASCWSPSDATIVNGFNLSAHTDSDIDDDGTPDIVEFVVNEMRLLMAR
jgi:hypothetical protein